jgi:hypothetical protein
MDIGKMINQAIKIITKPKQALQEVSTQSITRNDIIIYLAIIGIPTFIGILIGYGFLWYWGATLIVPALVGAIIYYIVAIIGIILFGYLINAFAPTFKSQQNPAQALKLVAFAATPWLLAGILYILPGWLWPVVLLAGLYGLYILYLGLPILMGTPQDQQLPYMIVGVVIFIVIMGAIWWITQTIIWNMVWHTVWHGYPYYNHFRY